ncbi:MAG: hypothetical protein MK080_01610 [Opitutales bacterium]|nr:hypothetical protein [Opitutales bacterium]
MSRVFSLFIFCCLSLAADEQTVRIVGSDFMTPWLEQVLRDSAVPGPEGVVLSFDMNGSLPAVSQIRLEEAQAGVVAIPHGEVLPAEPLIAIPIAYKVSRVFVNESNRISEITLGRLADVFGESGSENIQNWGDLSLTQEWASRTIQPALLSGVGILSDTLFRAVGMNNQEFSSSIERLYESDALEALLRRNSNALGIGERIPEQSGIRQIAVARTVETPGYLPTESAVFFGDYPLVLPFYLVTAEHRRGDLVWLIRYMLSDGFAQNLEQQDFVPVPSQERQRLLIEMGQ